MAQTIKGGAFQLPDNSWINAAGRPIPAPPGDSVYVRPEEPEYLTAGQVTPGSDFLPPYQGMAGSKEYEGDPEFITDSAEDKPKARRASKK